MKVDASDPNVLSLLLCASNSHSAKLMVSIVQPIVQNRKPGTTLLTALNVIDPIESSGGVLSTWLYQKKNYFGSVLKAARNRAKMLGIKLETSAIIGEDVAKEICEQAKSQKANLVLLSCVGHKLYTNSSVVMYVDQHLEGSDLGILIAHVKSKPVISQVLVPILDGPQSSAALNYAKLLANGEKISITLLHIMKSPVVDPKELNSIMELTVDSTKMKVSYTFHPPYSM